MRPIVHWLGSDNSSENQPPDSVLRRRELFEKGRVHDLEEGDHRQLLLSEQETRVHRLLEVVVLAGVAPKQPESLVETHRAHSWKRGKSQFKERNK